MLIVVKIRNNENINRNVLNYKTPRTVLSKLSGLSAYRFPVPLPACFFFNPLPGRNLAGDFEFFALVAILCCSSLWKNNYWYL